MKKKTITLLAGTVVLLVLCVTALYLTKTQPEDEESDSSESEGVSIISLEASVQSIEVKNESGSYVIKTEDNAVESSSEESSEDETSADESTEESDSSTEDERQWNIEDLGSLPQYNSMYSDLASLMTELSADSTLSSPGELSVYGLDAPAEATASYDDGSTLTLQIGDLTPDASGYYCKLSDQDTIYILSSTNGEKFFRSILDYVDLTITPTIDTVTYESSEADGSDDDSSSEAEETSTLNVSSITIQRSGYEDVVFTAQDNELVRDGNKIDDDLSSQLLSAISGITADSTAAVFPSQEEKEGYGLVSPTAKISYTVSGETYTLIIGNGTEAETDDSSSLGESSELEIAAGISSYYVMVEGTDAVFLVSKDYLPWLSMDLD